MYLDKILGCVGTENEKYITDQALGDIEPSVAKAFKIAFGGKNPEHTITVDYTFPDNTTNFEALYVINRGGSQNQEDSIGNNVQQYDNWDTGLQTEQCKVIEDEQGVYMETSRDIGDILDIPGLLNDMYSLVEPNRINLGKPGFDTSSFIGVSLEVKYYPKLGGKLSNNGGVGKGFTLKDSLNVYLVSSNMDTLRCLDNLITFIIILMKEVDEGPFSINLPTISKEPISLVDNTPKDLPVYGRDLSFGYSATYSVHYDIIDRIKSVDVKETIKES